MISLRLLRTPEVRCGLLACLGMLIVWGVWDLFGDLPKLKTAIFGYAFLPSFLATRYLDPVVIGLVLVPVFVFLIRRPNVLGSDNTSLNLIFDKPPFYMSDYALTGLLVIPIAKYCTMVAGLDFLGDTASTAMLIIIMVFGFSSGLVGGLGSGLECKYHTFRGMNLQTPFIFIKKEVSLFQPQEEDLMGDRPFMCVGDGLMMSAGCGALLGLLGGWLFGLSFFLLGVLATILGLCSRYLISLIIALVVSPLIKPLPTPEPK